MGNREQPITNRMKYGRLRRYKCRVCDRTFKDYYLPEEERVCPKCAEDKGSSMEEQQTNVIGWIDIGDVIVPQYHRVIKPWALEQLKRSMRDHGYNIAYPITLDGQETLVDGGHRLEAAKELGIPKVPWVPKPDGVSPIRFSLHCNADGQLSAPDDVFDLAELCYGLSQDGWEREHIAQELGWSPTVVTQYKQIKELLHPSTWEMIRTSVAKTPRLATADDDGLATPEVAIVTWHESHFRALLKHLPWTDEDRATMRAQLSAIHDIIKRAHQPDKRFGATQKVVTARWIEQLAQKYAWHVKLGKYMCEHLVAKVGIRDRVNLLRSVKRGVFGDSAPDDNLKKFDTAVRNLNEKVLGVILYCDDALQRLPLLEDASVALVVTDPPYNVTDCDWDRIGNDEDYLEFTAAWLDALRPKLAKEYHLFFFCDPSYQARIEQVLHSGAWPLKSRIIWSNRSLPSGRNLVDRFAQTWQMVFHCGTHKLNWPPDWSDDRFDVQTYAAPNGNTPDGGYHPTPKPVKLIELLVEVGSKPTDTVLDLFAGGGATGEACTHVQQRQCILIENNDTFCSAIEERLQIRREGR